MKNIKIWIGIVYLILLFVFLYFLFSNFSIEEVTTYNFIRSNIEYLVGFKDANLALVSAIFIILSILILSLLKLMNKFIGLIKLKYCEFA